VIIARTLAPIALFAYNRPQHLRRTVEALANNPLASDSDLHLFLDGPKTEEDVEAVAEVREYASGIKGFRFVSLVEHEKNQGLSVSIVGGVSYLLESCERVIVLEDDIVTSPQFLEFLNDGLETYDADPEVASIHGYMYDIQGLPETFFLRGADCWGWATWRRAWRFYNPEGRELLGRLKRENLTQLFDLEGACENTRMLDDQVAGRNDSWAIRWHASAFLEGMLTLHPGQSLVQNIGNDSSGTHCGSSRFYDTTIQNTYAGIKRLPVQENAVAREKFKDFCQNKLSPRRNFYPVPVLLSRILKALGRRFSRLV